MKHRNHKYIKKIPTEVLEAYAILQNESVGSFLYNKVVETVNKHPRFFVKEEQEWAKNQVTNN